MHDLTRESEMAASQYYNPYHDQMPLFSCRLVALSRCPELVKDVDLQISVALPILCEILRTVYKTYAI
jgi:hypothetical protein